MGPPSELRCAPTWTLLRARPFLAALIASLALFQGAVAFVWGRGLPENGGPDEDDHLAVAVFVAAEGRLPILGKDAGPYLGDEVAHRPLDLPSPEPGTGLIRLAPPPHGPGSVAIRADYSAYPCAAYVLQAAGIRAAGHPYHGARAVQAVLVALASLVIGLVALRSAPDRPVAVAIATACSALLPQHAFLGSYANSDAWGVLVASAVAWRAAVLLSRNGPGVVRDGLLYGVAAGCCMLTRVAPMTALAVCTAAVAWGLRREPRRLAAAGCAAALAAAAIAGPWWVHNLRHYGDALGLRATRESLLAFAAKIEPASLDGIRRFDGTQGFREQGTTLGLLLSEWTPVTLVSAVGKFGWMKESLRPWQLAAWAGAFAAAAAGLHLGRRGGHRDRSAVAGAGTGGSSTAAAWIAALWIAAQFALCVSYTMREAYQAQGRFLLPALPGIAWIVGTGWDGLLARFAPHARGAAYGAAGLVAALAAVLLTAR